MTEIRIKQVYHRNDGDLYINLKQVEKGKVIYTEDHYPTRRSCRPFKSEPVTITTAEANKIFKELSLTATPYIRYEENGLFEPMR